MEIIEEEAEVGIIAVLLESSKDMLIPVSKNKSKKTLTSLAIISKTQKQLRHPLMSRHQLLQRKRNLSIIRVLTSLIAYRTPPRLRKLMPRKEEDLQISERKIMRLLVLNQIQVAAIVEVAEATTEVAEAEVTMIMAGTEAAEEATKAESNTQEDEAAEEATRVESNMEEDEAAEAEISMMIVNNITEVVVAVAVVDTRADTRADTMEMKDTIATRTLLLEASVNMVTEEAEVGMAGVNHGNIKNPNGMM